jgi:mono/diheme cytochrome c family protein
MTPATARIRTWASGALVVGAFVATAFADSAGAAEPPTGKQLFERHCAPCHAPGFGHPGTMQLERVRGKALAVLEERKDLLPAYIAAVVRNGLVEMPPYRPTEIDDAALNALVNYLAPRKAAPDKAVSKRR